MNLLLRAVRRLASAPLFRRLTGVTPLMRLSFALRASLVHERVRFVRNELRRQPVTATYRVSESGFAVALRHHTDDVLVLDEIFAQGEYEPPEGVALVLPPTPSVVDLGANIGLFGVWLLGRFPDAAIVAYEADPGNAAVHRLAIEANGLGDRWSLVEAFAGAEDGRTTFVAGLHALSHAGDGIEVRVADALPDLIDADLVKIDVEGAEWRLLADPRFLDLRAAIVILEFHAEGCPGTDPAGIAERTLAACGYDVLSGPRKPAYGAGMLWGVHPRARSAQTTP